ncbi:uncharacterized protein DUF2851 [Pedobacter psychrotolerans]|uniref:Uncharacterized protein DUF2851 n=1 Tax=Pedobacter psychrotolerans TaxID=1843235 RepID=A0A4R2HQW0_9SPHI|nr:DUF2851 family protein [Pedobacter psychrotolerans]TCO31301.1 uncharacterized protein DUF2851 [Pedobacter psychrotolerans]GGE40728.1 hypothetical protein GCM10011413_03200 [Pedobacter psychrotolerans]
MNFSEDFLHYVWQFKSFDHFDLKTADGQNLKVIHQGFLNKNAGPDFNQAKIEMGKTVWVGNVEIHLKSSDWLKHHHQTDLAYENVILHVVYEHDVEIKRMDGSVLPVLILKYRIANELIEKYENLYLSLNDFPCAAQIGSVDQLIIDSFLSRTLIERFEQKTHLLFESLEEARGNWDETFYQFMARNFGFKVNALPFEFLAEAIPQQIFRKHKNNQQQIEALVFGTAGFLNHHFEEEYPNKLKSEFGFLQKKYTITPIEASNWKFMRMRPQNFPTLRLAQFAALILNSNHLFSKIIEIKDIKELSHLFEDLPVNPYWKEHYHFHKKALSVNTQIGKKSVENILLNTVALFLFAYGKHTGTQSYINRAILLLESLPPEKNAITDKFIEAGVKIEKAFASQAILQLKKQYCDHKKCLSCGIGIRILKPNTIASIIP